MAGQRNPELARLLANLSASNLQNLPSQPANHTQPYSSPIPGLGFLPPEPERKAVPQSGPVPGVLTPSKNARLAPQQDQLRSTSTTPTVPDASAITTWAAAMKHVTKHIANNPRIADKIKRMIAEQQNHEQQWWAQRQAIVERHQGRSENQMKVAEMLKTLGGLAIPVAASDPKADEAELAAHDKKVYKALTDMVAHFDVQLRAMGIPFYAIKHELVILEIGKEKAGAMSGRIDKGELRELQKRMLQHLEDLFLD